MLDECRREAFFAGERRQSGIGNSQPLAVLIAPGSKERLGIAVESEGVAAFAGRSAKAVIAIDLADAMNGGQLQPGLARIGEKLQRPATDDSVSRNFLGRFEIAFQAG